ncbi:MAG TPA: peptidoglycan DD-metalloendopeptidase family protein [Candidatus Dormibacteraeota bacterium]
MRGGILVRGIVPLTIAASLFAIAEPTAADQITDHISQEQRQLNQAKAEIASLKAQIAAAQNQETALTAIIRGLNHQIASTQAQVAAANAKLDAINSQLTTAQSQLAEARVLLGTEEHELSQELVVYYEFENESTPLSNLLTSGSFNEFWTDVIDGGRISARELQTLNIVTAQRDEVQTDVERITRDQQQQQQLLSQLYVTEQSLDDAVSARTEAVAYLAQIQAQDERSAQEWEAAENTINGQIAQLQKEEAAARAAGGGSGHFIWPDTGPISQGFGCTPYPFEPYDPACPQKHFHNGLDIAGACGHHIIAANAGIAYIEPYEPYGFGHYIIIVNGNGWQTLYGHLASFAIHNGQTVATGQLIGYEGTSGNSTGCHLHFGVNHNGHWVNPRLYLS